MIGLNPANYTIIRFGFQLQPQVNEVYSIRHRIVSRIIIPFLTRHGLLRYLVRHGYYFLTSILTRWNIHTVQNASGHGRKQINILYLSKAGHNEDVMACFQNQDGYGLHAMDRKLIKDVFESFLPVEIDDNSYLSTDPKIEQGKTDLRLFWKNNLKLVFRKINIDAVLTGSYTYASEQELAGAVKELGIPFIALHKENLKTPGLEPFYQEVYCTRKNPFQGSKICVYNEIEARLERQAAIAADQDIIVTGMPRLDRLHRLREQLLADQGQLPLNHASILFFSFNRKAGLPVIGRKLPQSYEKLNDELESLNCERLARTCHQLMLQLATDNPELQVIVKTKGDNPAIKTIAEYYGRDFTPPPNMTIMHGGDLLTIMPQATVVCGFNSTALLEALALGKTIVIPNFFEAVHKELQPYIVEMGRSMDYADSPDDFKNRLMADALAFHGGGAVEELTEEARQLLDKWLGNPDGQSGARVRAMLEDTVSKRS